MNLYLGGEPQMYNLARRVLRNGLAGVMMAVLLAGLVAAEEVQDDKQVFALQAAIEYALQNSSDMKRAEINYLEAQMTLKQTEANQLLSGSRLELQQAQLAFRKAANAYTLAQQDVAQSVEQAYYSVLKAQAGRQSAADALARAEKQYQIVKAKFDSGVVAELDVIEAENNLAARKADLAQAESDLEISQMRFNKALGRPLMSPVELAEEDSTYAEVTMTLEEAVEHALSNRFELIAGQEEVNLCREEVKLKDNDYTPEMEKSRARYALQRAELNLSNLKTEIQLAVRENYSKLNRAKAQIELLRGNVELAKRRLEIAQVRYEAGLSTTVDLIAAQNALSDAEAQAAAAVYDYNLAKASFYRSIGKLPYELKTVVE